MARGHDRDRDGGCRARRRVVHLPAFGRLRVSRWGKSRAKSPSRRSPQVRDPLLTYNGSTLEWVGGLAVLRASGDAHAIGAAHGRLLAPLLPAMRGRGAAVDRGDDHRRGLARPHHAQHAPRVALAVRRRRPRRERSPHGRRHDARRRGERRRRLVRRPACACRPCSTSVLPAASSGELVGLGHSLTVIAPQAQTPAPRVDRSHRVALPGSPTAATRRCPSSRSRIPTAGSRGPRSGGPASSARSPAINAQGIAVIVDPARTGDIRPTRTARPIALLARSILEQAKTLDEAVKLVEQTPTLGSAVIVIVDGSTGKWLIVERTPEKAIVERNPKLPAFGDTLTTNALSSDPENDRAKRMLDTGSRRTRRAPRALAARRCRGDRRGAARSTRRRRQPSPTRPSRRDRRRPPDPAGDPRSGVARAVGRRSARRRPDARVRSAPRAARRRRSRGAARRHRRPIRRPIRIASHRSSPRARELRVARAALARGDRQARRRSVRACARARARAYPKRSSSPRVIAQARGDDAHARKLVPALARRRRRRSAGRRARALRCSRASDSSAARPRRRRRRRARAGRSTSTPSASTSRACAASRRRARRCLRVRHHRCAHACLRIRRLHRRSCEPYGCGGIGPSGCGGP